ncbi:MAG: IS630 family transposase [Anaerolineales bacterium]
MRPYGTPDQLERRRRQALRLLQHGHSPVEVARQLGVDRRSVRRWKAAFQKRGAAALTARPARGRPARLRAGQKRGLQRALLRGAQAAGFENDLWTCRRVAAFIQQRFAIRYERTHVCRLLHGLGFTPQKPQRRAVERDEAAIRQWVQEVWPALKKKPRA